MSGGGAYLPVQTDTKHAIVPQSCAEKVAILATFAKLTQRTIIQGDLTHLTTVSISQSLRSAGS